MSILHKKLMQVVLVKELDIQDIVTLKKYDKKVKKFLQDKAGLLYNCFGSLFVK